MQQIFRCINCGSAYTLGQQFCSVCGNYIQYQCPQCQNEITPGARYCTQCAAVLSWELQQQTLPSSMATTNTPYPQEMEIEPVKSITIDNGERNKKSRSSRPWFIGLIVIIIAIIVLFTIDTFSK